MSKLSELIKILKKDPDLVDSMLQDWDYTHLLYIMQWKLARMEVSQRNGQHIGCEKQAQDIMVAKNLLKRIQLNDYMSEKHTTALNAWWDARTETELENGSTMMEFPDDSKLNELLEIENKKTKALEEHDWNYLLKILQRKMRMWWN